MTLPAPLEPRAAPLAPAARRWADIVAIGASLLLLAVSFTSFYKYSYGPGIVQMCVVDGGSSCGGTIVTRTAWHGYLGWVAVVLALIAAVCLASTRVSRRANRRTLAYVALTLYLLATACMVAVVAAIPNFIHSPQVIRSTFGEGVRYRDIVTNHLEWGYWVALPLTVIGLAAATFDVLLLRRSATPRSRLGLGEDDR